MVIIVSKNSKNARKVKRSDIEKEAYLQQYIHDNPDTIPVYEIDETKRLLVVKREFPTNSGPIDALAIDQDGEIYIVETKLYKNPDKRIVLAQILDYGAAMWRHSTSYQDFLDIINDDVKRQFNATLEEKLQEFYGKDDVEIEELNNALMSNLEGGRFKFIVLMDHLDDRLKDLVQYVNQNSMFDVYPVELELNRYEDYEILIPRLFGAGVKKSLTDRGSGKRRRWTEETLLEKMKEEQQEDYEDHLDLFNYLKENSDDVRYGTGTRNASYAPILTSISETMFPISIYSNGRVLIKFSWPPFIEMFGEKNEHLAEFVVSELIESKVGEYTADRMLSRETRVHFDDLKDGIGSVKKLFNKIKETATEL